MPKPNPEPPNIQEIVAQMEKLQKFFFPNHVTTQSNDVDAAVHEFANRNNLTLLKECLTSGTIPSIEVRRAMESSIDELAHRTLEQSALVIIAGKLLVDLKYEIIPRLPISQSE